MLSPEANSAVLIKLATDIYTRWLLKKANIETFGFSKSPSDKRQSVLGEVLIDFLCLLKKGLVGVFESQIIKEALLLL